MVLITDTLVMVIYSIGALPMLRLMIAATKHNGGC